MRLTLTLIALARLLARWAEHELDRGERAYGGKAWR